MDVEPQSCHWKVFEIFSLPLPVIPVCVWTKIYEAKSEKMIDFRNILNAVWVWVDLLWINQHFLVLMRRCNSLIGLPSRGWGNRGQ